MKSTHAPVAQLDRALVFGTKGWGFELLQVHQNSFFEDILFSIKNFLKICNLL